MSKESRGRREILLMLVFVAVGMVVGFLFSDNFFCSPPFEEQKSPPKEKKALLSYRMFVDKDNAYGDVRLVTAKVVLPEHSSRAYVEQVAREVVEKITASRKVNGIRIMFYGPQTWTKDMLDVALVDWAPNGQWTEAGSVRAGDYSAHQYNVIYYPPVPPLPSGARHLVSSDQKGLLDVPLPGGFSFLGKRTERFAGSLIEREVYEIDASRAEIRAFFTQALLERGWLQVGGPRASDFEGEEGPLIIGFHKDPGIMLWILINDEGGGFTLEWQHDED